MDSEKYEKALKNAIGVAIIILILSIILFVLNITSGVQMNNIQIISAIIQFILIIATIVGLKQKAIYGPICGIIVSILMILSLSLIDIIIGVLYLIDNINIMRYMGKN